jgi:hypothetical protein
MDLLVKEELTPQELLSTCYSNRKVVGKMTESIHIRVYFCKEDGLAIIRKDDSPAICPKCNKIITILTGWMEEQR